MRCRIARSALGISALTLTLVATIAINAQATKPAPPPTQNPAPAQEEQLTAIEQRGLQSILNDYQKLQGEAQELNKQMYQIEEDVKKDHPGYELDRNSMKLVKVKPAEPAKKGDTKK